MSAWGGDLSGSSVLAPQGVGLENRPLGPGASTLRFPGAVAGQVVTVEVVQGDGGEVFDRRELSFTVASPSPSPMAAGPVEPRWTLWQEPTGCGGPGVRVLVTGWRARTPPEAQWGAALIETAPRDGVIHGFALLEGDGQAPARVRFASPLLPEDGAVPCYAVATLTRQGELVRGAPFCPSADAIRAAREAGEEALDGALDDAEGGCRSAQGASPLSLLVLLLFGPARRRRAWRDARPASTM